MNKLQNIKGKKYKDRISELEVEVSLLRQKLEIIGKICGLDDLARVPAFQEKMSTARPIATVRKSGDNVVFQTNSEEDKKYLEGQIESKKEIGKNERASLSEIEEKKEQKEDRESFATHMKR